MFHNPAWAVGSYSSGPPAGGTFQIKVNPTQVRQEMGHPVQMQAEKHNGFWTGDQFHFWIKSRCV